MSFDGDSKAGEKLLKAFTTDHPKISMLFGIDSPSTMAVRDVINATDAARMMIAGCYTTEDQMSTMSRMPQIAAVAEFTPTRLLRRAISLAVTLSQGKTMPSVVEFRINVTEISINPSALKARFADPNKSPDPLPAPSK